MELGSTFDDILVANICSYQAVAVLWRKDEDTIGERNLVGRHSAFRPSVFTIIELDHGTALPLRRRSLAAHAVADSKASCRRR